MSSNRQYKRQLILENKKYTILHQRNTVKHIRLTMCISEVGGLFHVTEGMDWAILWNLNDQVFFLRYSMSNLQTSA